MSKQNAGQDLSMSVHAHIKELRGRLFQIALVFILFSFLAYYFRDFILGILLAPLHGEKLSYLTVGGGFAFIFKTTMWVGIALTLPFIVYSLYKFVAPALPKRAQKKAAVIILVSFFLLVSGVSFGYFYAIPGAIRFLLTFADSYVNAMLTADSYLSFVLAYTIGLGLLFQIPLLMLLIHWVYPQKPLKLLKFEKYVVVVAFVIAAFITPTPDALNQTVIAMPIVIMYQAGVVAVWWSLRREKKKAAALARRSKAAVQAARADKQVASYHAERPRQPITSKPLVAASVVDTSSRRLVSDMVVRKSSGRRIHVPNRSVQSNPKPDLVRKPSSTQSIDGFRPYRIASSAGSGQ